MLVVLAVAMSMAGDLVQPEAAAAPAYSEAIENYEARELRGFRLMVNRDLVAEPALLEEVLVRLDYDLAEMEAFLPKAQLTAMREVTVWIERQGATVEGGMSGRGMCFHPSREWLTGHGLLAEKENGVEIVRAEDFAVWRRNQPYMTFHEFAHAYHWRLGFDDAAVKAAYDAAMEEGLYDAVDYNMAADGAPVRAYAASNEKEYFAELSEAYFGLNDFFPFTRRQLKQHDPRGFALMERVWGLSGQEIDRGGAEDAEIGDGDKEGGEGDVVEATGGRTVMRRGRSGGGVGTRRLGPLAGRWRAEAIRTLTWPLPRGEGVGADASPGLSREARELGR